MKQVAYTVLTSHTYSLKVIKHKTPGWRYICFSTKKIPSNGWEVVLIKSNHSLDSKKLSRRIKILNQEYLPGTKLSIYFDSKFVIKSDLDRFVSHNLPSTYDIAVMKHNKRICIYEEGKTLIKLKIDSPKVIKGQLLKYKTAGFPKNRGLYAPGIMIRKHNDAVQRLMECWFSQIEQHSYRDILSFPYCLGKNKVKLSIMPWLRTYNAFMLRKKK